jgi:hypothetical protein
MGADQHYLLVRERLTRAGFYWGSFTTGLVTTIAAGTSTAGHLFAARFNPSGAGVHKLFFLTHLRLLWQTVAGFTAAQEIGLAAYKLTGFSALHTGGSAAAMLALAPGYAASQLTGRVANTAELTAGTQTIANQLLRGSYAELAALSTVAKGFIDEGLPLFDDPHPIDVLAANEGILVRNEVLMGAGGTGRLTINIGGFERNAT